MLNPVEPYNTTGEYRDFPRTESVSQDKTSDVNPVLLNNYFGRQFNSLNDVTIHPTNLDIYFTDPSYGKSNNFRPEPGLPKQVYRLNDKTGAVTVAADGFIMPNGRTFS